MKISVIVPFFNEEKTIKELLERVYTSLLNLRYEFEIIVIDDGSTDNSLKMAENFCQNKKIIILHQDKNRGKGSAIRLGLEKAKGEIIILQDADLESNPNDYQKLVLPIIKKNADLVIGSRNIGGFKKERNLIYYWGGKFITFATNLFLGTRLTDATSGLISGNSKIKGLNLKKDGFEFDVELIAKAKMANFRLIEVPISYNPRKRKDGKKLKTKDGLKQLLTLLRLRFLK